MSGGHFDYKQSWIQDIHDSVEQILLAQGKPKAKEDLWCNEEYYEKFPEDKFYPVLRKDVEEKFKEALNVFKLAYIYAQRIDWYLSGDDGEDSFIEKLEEGLKEVNNDTN